MKISLPQIMNTPAGYYIGTTYYDEEMKGWFPYSRDSHYMSRAEAEYELFYINAEREEEDQLAYEELEKS